jgi:hypothetical protein
MIRAQVGPRGEAERDSAAAVGGRGMREDGWQQQQRNRLELAGGLASPSPGVVGVQAGAVGEWGRGRKEEPVPPTGCRSSLDSSNNELAQWAVGP